jgi:hypothetical protein
MEVLFSNLSKILHQNLQDLLVYVIFFIVVSFALYYLAKIRKGSSTALATLQIIHTVLRSRLGDKASGLIAIWIEGLKKIQDGEFSREDGIDQFVRYIKLASTQNGIVITAEDEIAIQTLVQSTLDIFVGKSQSQISLAVNKFNAMNAANLQK